jgi:hypothetical protein
MKMYKFEVYVIDLDDRGMHDAIHTIEDMDGVLASVMNAEVTDIGEFSDDHPLNSLKATVDEHRSYYG